MFESLEKLAQIESELIADVTKYVNDKGGFVMFDIDTTVVFPDCPRIRVLELSSDFNVNRCEDAHDHLVYAIRTDRDALEFFTSQLMETYTLSFTKEEMLSKENEDNWIDIYSDALPVLTIQYVASHIQSYLL